MDKIDDPFFTSLKQLSEWVINEQYSGWDPYDGNTGNRLKIITQNKRAKLLMRLFNVYSPVNFRPFFEINKNVSNKALALFSRSFLYLFRFTNDLSYSDEAKKILDILIEKKIQGDDWAWSDYFSYAGSSTPDIVVTSEAIKSFTMASALLGDKYYQKIAKSAIDLIIDKFYIESSNECYIKYTPHEESRIVFNASALSLEAFSSYLVYEKINTLIAIGNNITEFLLKNQKKVGYWPYSYYPQYKFFYQQIDYHQGFILDGLFSFLPYLKKELQDKTMISIRKGAEFYMEKQFKKNGSSYYRYPIRYPIDIHNQAQGIITFSKLSRINKEYLNFAKQIALWTINNMQSKDKYFYSQKWPILLNKIPYMRWSQAWMMLALATLLEENKKINLVEYK